MATWPELVQTGVAAVSALGSVGAIAWFVAKRTVDHNSKKWLKDHQSELDRQLADHKAELEGEADKRRLAHKRQELMFEREVLAAKAFFELYDDVYPKARGPEPDWYYDAVPEIAEDYSEIEDKIAAFLRTHRVGLSEETITLLNRAQNEAREGSFLVGEETQGAAYEQGRLEAGTAVRESVDRFWSNFTEAGEKIRSDLKSGTL